MSGGIYDYAFSRVDDFAFEFKANTELRKEFKEHLLQVSEAMHDIEWLDLHQ